MSDKKEHIKINKYFIGAFFRLFKLYWTSSEKWRAGLFVLLAVILTFSGVQGSVLFNEGNKAFFDALQQFNMTQVLSSFIPFSIGIFLWIGSDAFAFNCKERLSAKWRLWLTKHHLFKWLTFSRHYHLQIEGHVDNPDQRISEDLENFPMLTIKLFFLLLSAILIIISYTPLLWGTSSTLIVSIAGKSYRIYGYLFWCAIFYGVISILITQKIGKKLSTLDFSNEQYGANFRFSLVRAREASEQIALLNSGPREAERLMGLFNSVFMNTLKIIALRTRLNFCTGFFNGSGAIVGSIAALPLFFSKQIQIGTLMQISGAFSMIFSSFAMLALSFDVFAQWKSVVFRLAQFKDKLDHLKGSADTYELRPHEQLHLNVNNLTIYLPNGLPIVKHFNFSFHPGMTYLIQGKSGKGKSILLRTIAGIWPYAEGKVFFPSNKSILFIPQKPYLPVGSLKEILLEDNNSEFDDRDLKLILEEICLQKYSDNLNDVQNWQQILSLGEQQLLFLAQIFIKKPDIIFLDESTSALDEDAETYFYQALKNKFPDVTLISVGHRTSLHRFHTHTITLDEEKNQMLIKNDEMSVTC
jgi:putative ATP-binding cassette transporter